MKPGRRTEALIWSSDHGPEPSPPGWQSVGQILPEVLATILAQTAPHSERFRDEDRSFLWRRVA